MYMYGPEQITSSVFLLFVSTQSSRTFLSSGHMHLCLLKAFLDFWHQMSFSCWCSKPTKKIAAYSPQISSSHSFFNSRCKFRLTITINLNNLNHEVLVIWIFLLSLSKLYQLLLNVMLLLPFLPLDADASIREIRFSPVGELWPFGA